MERDAVLCHHPHHLIDLQTHNLPDFSLVEGREGDDVVDSVEELGTEDAAELFALGIAGHDDDGVLEVHHTSFVVGQPSIVKHLQEGVEHVGMRFLNLVEKHDGIRFAAHCLCELTALFVADVARRRTDESGDTKLLLILAHVDTGHHGLVVEKVVGQGFSELRLTHTCGAEEDEGADGSLRVLQSCTTAAHGIADGTDGFILTNDTLVQFLFQVDEFGAFGGLHLAHGDARPTAHHIGDVVAIDLFLHQCCPTLCFGQFGLHGLDVLFQTLQFAIADFCHTSVVAFTFSLVSLKLQLLNLLLVALNLVEQCLLAFPLVALLLFVSTEGVDDFVQFGKFLLVAFTLDGLTFNLQLLEPTAEFVNLFWHGVTLHTEFGGSLIHQVNRLVGQETVGDVTVAEFNGCNNRLILDTHLVVVLVAFLQATQDGDGGRHIGFIDHDRLETAFECLVLLKVFLVLVEGGGTDGAEFATCQGRLEDTGGIHCSARLSCTHEGVNLVDEEDNLPLTLHHSLDHSLESFLKLTLILGTGNQCTHIKRVELLVLQVFRHIATHDTTCQAFHDSGFTRTRLTNKNRIIFSTTAQNLQDSTNLLITTDDGVELAIPCPFHEVRCIEFKNLLGRRLLPILILIVVVHNSTWFFSFIF